MRRFALVLLQLAGVWAVARASGLTWAWLLALPGVLSLRLQVRPVPRLQALLQQSVRLALLALVGFGAVWVLSPQLPSALAPRVGLIAAWLLVLLSVPLALSVESVAPQGGLLRACLGVLLGAALDPQAPLTGPLLLGFAALVLFLAAGVPGRANAWLGFSLLAASSLAYGLVEFLPWAQPQVETAVANAMAGGEGVTGFGPSASLGDVAALGLSRRTALRVYGPLPLKLRGQVLTRFDGRSWSAAPSDPPGRPQLVTQPTGGPAWLARPGPTPSVGAGASRLHYTVLPALGGSLLFVPADTYWARVTSGRLSWGGAGLLRVDAMPAAYEALASPGTLAPGGEPACERCLSLPDRLDPRFAVLAGELNAGSPSPQERVARTLAHLGRTCRYTLKPGPFRTRDPLAEFLFEKRRGYCEYFASAAAVLLRLQGVETRYVKGFNLAEDQRLGDHYLVRESAAHAWIDVRLPGLGWSEQDPTPASDYAREHAAETPGAWSRAWEALASLLSRLRAWFALQRAGGGSPWLRLGLALVAVLGLVFAVRRLRLRPRAPVSGRPGLSPELARLVRLLDAHCERNGHARPASRGLLEHLRGLPAGSLSDEWRVRGLAAAEQVYAAAYGGATLTPDELRALGARLERR